MMHTFLKECAIIETELICKKSGILIVSQICCSSFVLCQKDEQSAGSTARRRCQVSAVWLGISLFKFSVANISVFCVVSCRPPRKAHVKYRELKVEDALQYLDQVCYLAACCLDLLANN